MYVHYTSSVFRTWTALGATPYPPELAARGEAAASPVLRAVGGTSPCAVCAERTGVLITVFHFNP